MGSARGSFFTANDDEEEGEEADHIGMTSMEFMEAGFSGNGSVSQGQSLRLSHHHSPYSSRPSMASLRNIPYTASPIISPESHYRAHYFLDSCALCQKPLGNHRDIFMYRGDTAFCSEECRQERMEMDTASEKNRSLSSLGNDQTSKSDKCHIHTGTVAAA